MGRQPARRVPWRIRCRSTTAIRWSIGEGPASPTTVAEDLSPDALMAYCQTRLDSIDGQVKASFDDQQKNASATAQIDQVIASIKQYDGADQTDPAVCTHLETQFQGLITNPQEHRPGLPCPSRFDSGLQLDGLVGRRRGPVHRILDAVPTSSTTASTRRT